MCLGKSWAQNHGKSCTISATLCMNNVMYMYTSWQWLFVHGLPYSTISGLQSCLLSLKGDMDKLHQQMDQHSAAVRDSYKSSRWGVSCDNHVIDIVSVLFVFCSRQIESRIKSLKKSQGTHWPHPHTGQTSQTFHANYSIYFLNQNSLSLVQTNYYAVC